MENEPLIPSVLGHGEEDHPAPEEPETRQEEIDALLLPTSPAIVDPGPSQSTKRQLLIYAFPALLLCYFVIRFDSSYVIGNYSRRIAVDLHDFQNARWIVLGFLVTESSCCPLYGHAAQVYGHRKAILFAATALSSGLLLCSLSTTLWQVAVSRVVVGTGTAGIELLVVVIMNDLVELYELPLWTSAAIVCGTVGLMLGGPVGAALTDNLGFRPTFAIEFCSMIITFVTLYFTLRLPQPQANTSEYSAKRLEYPSSASLLVSVAAPLFALNLGGEVFAWDHPLVITLFCITPALIIGFYYVETHIAITPIIPKRFIYNRNIAIALTCILPMKFCFDQLRFSFGTYLEARSFDNDSSYSDWALTCVYLGRAGGTVLSGILIKQYRRFKLFLQIDIMIDIVIYLSFASGWIHAEKPSFAPVLAFVGATEGFAEGLWLVALLSLVDTEGESILHYSIYCVDVEYKKDQALLYAFFELATAIAGDLGIAISLAAEGTLVRHKLVEKLSQYSNADEIIRLSLEDLGYIRQLSTKVQSIVLNAFITSTEAAFGISCLVLIISLVSSFYVKEMSRSPRDLVIMA